MERIRRLFIRSQLNKFETSVEKEKNEASHLARKFLTHFELLRLRGRYFSKEKERRILKQKHSSVLVLRATQKHLNLEEQKIKQN